MLDGAILTGEGLATMSEDPRFPPNRPTRTIEILTFADGQLLDVAGPMQVFASCNDLTSEPGGAPAYLLRTVAAGGGQVTMSAGLALATADLSPAGASLDTLIVAGGRGVEQAAGDARLLAWLRERAASARRIASVCTGAFLLAAAGLLDGRRAVTHWAYCAQLAERHPCIRVESDPIFIIDGQYWTSAGVTAGIDLALAMIEEDLGRDVALAVARRLVVFLKRPGGQAQFSATLDLQRGERFAPLHHWIRTHLAADLSTPALAAHAGMSERSLLRHYTATVGTTPARAVERLRVEAARLLLGDTDQPVKEIAGRCGFGSEETMRRSFLRLLEVTPQAYRARFAATDRPAARTG
jgi:transcriptional regulator GlxA family with amidase domain